MSQVLPSQWIIYKATTVDDGRTDNWPIEDGTQMKRLMIIVAMVLTPLEAFAMKADSYVPPPYLKRAVLSLGGLFPAAIVLGLVIWGIHYCLDRDTAGQRKWVWIGVVVVLMCTASLAGALDALNDEGWNPALFGGAVLGLLAPLSLYILNKRSTGMWRAVVFVPALVACLIAAVFLTEFWVDQVTGHAFTW